MFVRIVSPVGLLRMVQAMNVLMKTSELTTDVNTHNAMQQHLFIYLFMFYYIFI